MAENFIKEQHDVIKNMHRLTGMLEPLSMSFRDVGNDKMADMFDLVCGILKHDAQILNRIAGEQVAENLRNSEHATFVMMAGVLAAIARFGGEIPSGEAIKTEGEVTLEGAKERFNRYIRGIKSDSRINPTDDQLEKRFHWILTGID